MHDDQTTAAARALPASLQALHDLAYNLRWAWHQETRELFARLDSAAWEDSNHNPARTLQTARDERLAEAASDPDYLARLERAAQALRDELGSTDTWFDRRDPSGKRPLIAYFSAEFGVTESLPIYAGGLGVLAGDHLKSASDLGLPLVGIGLFYYEGYFQQSLDATGWQHDRDRNSDPEKLSLALVRAADGAPLTISVDFPERAVTAKIWQAQVGRIPLYLLDCRLPENRPEDRAISDRLYGGDLEMRISQEIMLGIGGYRAMEALGLEPRVIHMNEGHSAFLALERIRRLMHARGLSFDEARKYAKAGQIFTTHTPVAAGHDYFPSALMRSYFRPFAHELGLEWQDFMALGRVDRDDQQASFGMTTLAIRMSTGRNGVSNLHGEVTRRMLANHWPGTSEDEIPIGHVTNGVHLPTWLSSDLCALYDAHVGPAWRHSPASRDDWSGVAGIPDDVLWGAHHRAKERMVEESRRRLVNQISRRGASEAGVEAAAKTALDPSVLTIGFARRFTAYKRATLLLTDVDRLARIMNDPERPVQVVFAGKAHPRDDPGKLLIQRIASVASRPPFQNRLLFLEDYDIALAGRLVQGVDVWLNNPIRPQEASGTSGMKAAANGVLNLSTLDGWWDEAWQDAQARGEAIGWTVETDGNHDDAARDRAEAAALYEVLEREVIPMFYERNQDGLPAAWLACMRAAIHAVGPAFSANRMVGDYTEQYYLPAAGRVRDLD